MDPNLERMWKILSPAVAKVDAAWAEIVNTPKLFKEFQRHGVTFEVWRARGCCWNEILFIFSGEVVYDLKRMNTIGSGGDNFRQEYFKDKLVRTYEGWQNCFVEFFEFNPLDHPEFPKKEEFESAAKSLCLSLDDARLYERMYFEMFGRKEGCV